MRQLLSSAAIVVAMTATASAGPAVMVFPLSAGKLPTAMAKAPAKLTEALAKSIDAEVANVPIEDAAGLLDCDPEATPCLEAVSRSVKAKRIVFGAITADDDGAVKVTLTRFDPGPDRQQRTFELVSTTTDSMAEELARVAAPLFGKTAQPMVGDKPPPNPTDPDGPTGPTGPRGPRGPDDGTHTDPAHGSIRGSTWGIVGGGAAITGIGIALLVSARGIADEVDKAPRNTPQDFKELTALESKGETRQRLGLVLTAVGAVGLGYGIYRALGDRRAPPSEASAMHLTPVPLPGGAALVLTMGMP